MSYTDTCSMPIIMYCLGHFCCCLQTKKYDVAHVAIDMYIPTNFHGFISFSFWVMLVEEEEEEEDDDEQNSLS